MSNFNQTGKPKTYARWCGFSWMATTPRPDPFTSHLPAKPCTPRLTGRRSSADTDTTAERGKRDRNAQPIRTSTWSVSTFRYEAEGRNPTMLDSTRYQPSKLMGIRETSVATVILDSIVTRASAGRIEHRDVGRIVHNGACAIQAHPLPHELCRVICGESDEARNDLNAAGTWSHNDPFDCLAMIRVLADEIHVVPGKVAASANSALIAMPRGIVSGR
jgi:hypothetical protein